MLATIMNCVYVSEVFRSEGMGTQVMTPFECGNITKLYAKDDAMECLNNGKIVFLLYMFPVYSLCQKQYYI